MDTVMALFNISLLILCLSYTTALKFTHLTGKFGYQRIPLDITFGNGIMEVTTHKPNNAADTFRATTNLHIFPTRIVALRNWVDKECYIQHFNATEDEMKERVSNAITHHRDLGAVKEERINLKGLRPLLKSSVERILGQEIAEFCNMHDVYIIGRSNRHLLQPEDEQPNTREKRYVIDPTNGRGQVWIGDIIDGPRPKRPWKDIFVVC